MPPSGMYGVKQITLFSKSVVTASITGDGSSNTAAVHPGLDRYTSAEVMVSSGTGTGTSPTCNVYIQKLLPDGVTWTDLIAFTQITTAATKLTCTVISQVSSPYVPTDGTLTVATVKSDHIGCIWRVKVVIGGTNPSYATLTVTGNFYE